MGGIVERESFPRGEMAKKHVKVLGRHHECIASEFHRDSILYTSKNPRA
jgi:hypothetical protein